MITPTTTQRLIQAATELLEACEYDMDDSGKCYAQVSASRIAELIGALTAINRPARTEQQSALDL